ncbi:MAG TPA: hypothetical protein VFQ91_03360 [Bryobacteraceae bacterium]|nr:hypothetical protein [Bryobacteraceae bacterium]
MRLFHCPVLLVLAAALPISAQFASSGTTTMSVTVQPEAAIRIDTAVTTLTSTGTAFSNYTGTTAFTYKIRTLASGGSGAIQLQVTADFSPANGPSVASPPTAGDQLTYVCTVSAPGTGCTGTQVASTTVATSVSTFGANASSTSNGNSGSVSWTLTNDPAYRTGSYTATTTLTISAT